MREYEMMIYWLMTLFIQKNKKISEVIGGWGLVVGGGQNQYDSN
jgi:hypothetical protein